MRIPYINEDKSLRGNRKRDNTKIFNLFINISDQINDDLTDPMEWDGAQQKKENI